ncbi:MAG: hypothetical protein V7K38_25530 [Nostoc sp.]|uniref:hypothetical protein n=1 Tax=Nostoc sp. TaxID=1180 RepID=UPI002FF8E8ED
MSCKNSRSHSVPEAYRQAAKRRREESLQIIYNCYISIENHNPFLSMRKSYILDFGERSLVSDTCVPKGLRQCLLVQRSHPARNC